MMTRVRSLLSVVLVQTCWLLVTAADEEHAPPTGSTGAPRAVTNSSGTGTGTGSGTGTNGTRHHGAPGSAFSVDSSMIQRALYVLVGITMIGVLYFLIRAVRLKKPAQKKKYGLLSDYDDSVEMDAVDSDEDDTLYEARSLRR